MPAKAKAIDDTLEIVRDLSKYKERIEEMGKLQTEIARSGAKAKARQQALNLKMDAKVAEAAKIEKQAKALLKSANAAAASAAKSGDLALASAGRKEKDTTKRVEWLRQERQIHQAEVAKLSENRKEFAEKVSRFYVAAKAACKLV